jgi:hypothetical protein
MRKMLLCVTLALPISACFAQSETGTDVVTTEPMPKPSPASGRDYVTEVGRGRRENFLSAGLSGSFAYIDNLYPGSGTTTISEKLYTLLPSISVDKSTERQHISASYSPSFMLYQPSSELNEIDQNARLHLDYRLTPRLDMSVGESWLRSSTGFGQAALGGSGGISGTAPTLTPGVYAPFGRRTINDLDGHLSYQFSPHGMVGGTGQYSTLGYPDLTQGSGLYNSKGGAGGGFFYQRISAKQFVGASYEYQHILATPPGTEYRTDTHTISAFYTLFLTDTASISVSGGPEHYSALHAPAPATSAWSPSVTVSGGWHGRLVGLAGNVSHTVTGGGGLLGAFHTTSVGFIGQWQLSRNWQSALGVNYASNRNATPQLALSSPSGYSFVTSVSLQRALTPRLSTRFQYDRIQESYQQIQAIAANPTSNRGMVTLVWDLRRPIGR